MDQKDLLKQFFNELIVEPDFVKYLRLNKGWIMIAAPWIKEEDIESANVPNAYISPFYKDDKVIVDIGLSYNNIESVKTFEQLSSRFNTDGRTKILDLINSISNNWKFITYKRTKTGFSPSDRVPTGYEIKCKLIKDKELTEILEKIEDIRSSCHKHGDIIENGKKIIFEVPSFDLMCTQIEYSQDRFKELLSEVKSILSASLDIKPLTKIKKERKQRSKVNKEKRDQIEQLQNKITSIENELKQLNNKIDVTKRMQKFQKLSNNTNRKFDIIIKRCELAIPPLESELIALKDKLTELTEDFNICDCGRQKKTFMHTCPKSKLLLEIFGCPQCDDECGHCK
jgi:hypothetical protein